jgi:hypothetical protein
MKMGAVAVMFHWPKLPVIVISPKGLAAALDRKKLIAVLGAQTPSDTKFEVKVIDITGREFWYDTTQRILAPGFAAKVWTKRQLVQLYNDDSGATLGPYQPGSLPNRRLDRVVQEIANLLMGGQATRKRRLKNDTSNTGQKGQGAG